MLLPKSKTNSSKIKAKRDQSDPPPPIKNKGQSGILGTQYLFIDSLC